MYVFVYVYVHMYMYIFMYIYGCAYINEYKDTYIYPTYVHSLFKTSNWTVWFESVAGSASGNRSNFKVAAA